MQFQEIEFEVRRLIGQPNPLNSRFTPGVIQGFMQHATWKVAFDVGDLKSEYDTLTKVGDDEYIAPENTIEIHLVTLDGKKLEKRDQAWLHEHFYNWPNHDPSTPLYYYPRRMQDKLMSIGVYPRPSVKNLTLRMTCSVIPARTFDPTQEPSIRKAFHPLLIPLTTSICFGEMKDQTQQAVYENQYNQALGKMLNIAQNAGSDTPLAFTPASPLDNGANTSPWSWV